MSIEFNELQWLMTSTIFFFIVEIILIFRCTKNDTKRRKRSNKIEWVFFIINWELPVNYQFQYWHPFLFQWWDKFSTAFREMLLDAVVRASDFIGNPTAKSAINDYITKAFNIKAEVDTNGKVFRWYYIHMVFVESVLSKKINLKLFVT